MNSFNVISHELIDSWLKSDIYTTPESLYAAVVDRLNMKMALSIVLTEANDPYDWYFRRVRDFGFKSHFLERMRRELPDSALRHLDRGFVDGAVIPGFSRAVEANRPAIDMVRTKLVGFRVGYERIILPQKSAERPRWCISLTEGRFFMPPAQDVRTDMTDDNIIQLLMEGQTAKEMAALLGLSPRTIEHRIDKLKDRFEARNLVHLVAKLVAVQAARRDGD